MPAFVCALQKFCRAIFKPAKIEDVWLLSVKNTMYHIHSLRVFKDKLQQAEKYS